MIYCVDISKWQDHKKINYEYLTVHAPLIVCRLAYGLGLDPEVENHIFNILTTGRDPYGYYFYVTGITETKIKAEIDFAVEQLKRILTKYNINSCGFLAMDIESTSARAFENKPDCVYELMSYLEKQLKNNRINTKAGLYTSASRLNHWLKCSPILQQYFIWCAAYLTREEFKKRYPVAYKCAHMWQYTSQGRFPCAYDGNLDVNMRNYRGDDRCQNL